MNARRFGETGNAPFRTGRIYSVGVEWYAATRGGRDLGPFASHEEAKSAIEAYIADLLASDGSAADSTPAERADRAQVRLEEIREFMQRRETYGPAAARLWAQERIKQLDAESLPSAERRERLTALNYLLHE